MQVFGAMYVVATDAAVVGRGTGECYVCAQVVVPGGAVLAFVTGNAGLDRHAVARTEVCHAADYGEDLASGFVAKDIVILDDAGSIAPAFQK